MNVDQAAGLRRVTNPRPVKVIAVTGGKGGIGKSNVAVNLSVALAKSGRKVMLMDADLGLANIDVLLGLSPRYNLSHVVSGEVTLEEILIEGPEGILIVPASSGTKRMAELSPAENMGLVHAFSELNHAIDYLIIDTAAGIADSVINFSRAAREVLAVVCDEPSSITDAYALIKVLNRDYGVRRINVVANMTSNPQQGQLLYEKLLRVCDKYLNLTLSYLGAVPMDERLREAVQRQRAVITLYPSSPSSRALMDVARRIDQWPVPNGAEGNLEFFIERMVHFGADAEELA